MVADTRDCILIIRDRAIMFPKEHLHAIIEGALDFMMESIIRKAK
jgi:hypothetical protein